MTKPTTPARSRLVALKKWACEMGLPYSSVHDRAVRGEFPIVRLGRALYIERTDGDRYIESCKEHGGAA